MLGGIFANGAFSRMAGPISTIMAYPVTLLTYRTPVVLGVPAEALMCQILKEPKNRLRLRKGDKTQNPNRSTVQRQAAGAFKPKSTSLVITAGSSGLAE